MGGRIASEGRSGRQKFVVKAHIWLTKVSNVLFSFFTRNRGPHVPVGFHGFAKPNWPPTRRAEAANEAEARKPRTGLPELAWDLKWR